MYVQEVVMALHVPALRSGLRVFARKTPDVVEPVGWLVADSYGMVYGQYTETPPAFMPRSSNANRPAPSHPS